MGDCEREREARRLQQLMRLLNTFIWRWRWRKVGQSELNPGASR